MLTNFLRKRDADCTCGHTPDQHADRAGACTRRRYRGGLLMCLAENL